MRGALVESTATACTRFCRISYPLLPVQASRFLKMTPILPMDEMVSLECFDIVHVEQELFIEVYTEYGLSCGYLGLFITKSASDEFEAENQRYLSQKSSHLESLIVTKMLIKAIDIKKLPC